MRLITIVTVENDDVARQGFEYMLRDYEDISLVGHAYSATDGLETIQTVEPDVAIIDLGLPERNGNDLIAFLHEKQIKTKFLVVTGRMKQFNVLPSVRAGAQGYITKDTMLATDLVTAIRTVQKGGTYWGSDVQAKMHEELTEEREVAAEPLTRREREVLLLLARGYSYSEIATLLVLSPNTVPGYTKSIFSKLKVNSGGQATVRALKLKLITLEDLFSLPRVTADG